MMINPEYAKPILTLSNSLNKRNIPHTVNVIWDGLQIRFPWNDGDIICHSGSFGHEYGDVESMGCPWDDDESGGVTCLPVDVTEELITDWWTGVGD